MTALLAITILTPIMMIMGMCFYAQWLAMRIMKETPGICSAATMIANQPMGKRNEN